jgi:hypothetical protein
MPAWSCDKPEGRQRGPLHSFTKNRIGNDARNEKSDDLVSEIVAFSTHSDSEQQVR